MTSGMRWARFELGPGAALAPLFRGRGSGIYILEFKNGEYYVGKTIHALQRFTTHKRHRGDVQAILFREVPSHELDREEQATIAARRRAGWHLRNIMHNPGHQQPCGLDDLLSVSVEEQRHWALGHAQYDLAPLVAAAQRTAVSETRLDSSRGGRRVLDGERTVADLAVADLAAVIEHGIPDAVATERHYWTVSDYPATAGGRFLTLNAGNVEVLHHPRRALLWDRNGPVLAAVLNLASGSELTRSDVSGIVERNVDAYRGAGRIDRVVTPLGNVRSLLQRDDAVAALREFVLRLMCSGTSGKFARWHSQELARRAYQVISEAAKH